MNKPVKDQTPILSIERDNILLLAMAALSATFGYVTYILLRDMKPEGFLVMAPAAILAFQTLWFLLNPFAEIFSDRVEIRQSWFHRKERFFNDLTQVGETKKGEFFIRYTDGEVEKLSLFGIRRSQKAALKENCRARIAESAANRA